ncbi:unnamed protein product [Peronospora belbahrii]|uniref:Translation elongation factor IF5A C-terminal domain-containing protein n=1 Tax=Peronospora belbahrii TaxID=622444 RepID=A0AAU9KM37_9STRA|nr:unnamed protein product [Peronospora belbahrii]CAH0520630.1 unnamed protein product [Peronospora belbahrii]
MDMRCTKFWEDGQTLVAVAVSGPEATSRMKKTQDMICKELRTVSRFIQRNQSQRFSDAAQNKLVDCIGHYVGLGKQGSMIMPVAEALFQTVKDGLAMPCNVVGTKQKKRLLKWYNELIAIVGGDPDATIGGEIDVKPCIEWTVMDIDEDGYLSLLQVETGESNGNFQVKTESTEYRRIKKALHNNEVTVITWGDEIEEVRIEDE